MRFVITGEWSRNRLLQTIVVLYSLYVASKDAELVREAHDELEQLASQIPEAQREQFLDQELHRKVREAFRAATTGDSSGA